MPGKLRVPLGRPDTLTDRPDFALVGVLRVPQELTSPGRAIVRRIGYALAALMVAVIVVYLGRDGYRDVQDNPLSLLDCIYYASVSLSTTGYGDIAPLTPQARLINVLVITPLRVFFLIVLVGTTLSALTADSRQAFKIQRWRRRTRSHTVVVGYGTKGRSAVDALLADGLPPSEIVVVDTDPMSLDAASRQGLVTVHGSATKSDVLQLAGARHAASIIVAVSRDDTAVLVTLTARQLAPQARIAAAVRESENTHVLRQSGADTVVVSAETAGRLLGLAPATPTVVEMIEDLLTPEAGFAVSEREVAPHEVGLPPRQLPEIVLGVVRGEQLIRIDSFGSGVIAADDRLLYVRLVSN
ncbi:NAD-binding protein of Kef-type K+ transporter [Rhodococcus pyridinivorans SB3094]|nr:MULTISPECIES: potassium channel family protein [Rhodococcus]MXQ76555.1 potassium transporter Kef [Rhodococcus rhodochrous]AHD19833.1 NAD-binding protein of Kef-type K+ transporter [Rhodococcus pyridinivorans SB3094]MCT7289542.1 potassium channel family protein [Rhodococcus sp. PAE-6]OWY79879.1 potassium transporter Kef [Rhodococcus sp. BUPNP1]BDB60664.1 putative transmembrane cation transporter [Rhodococcus sp. RDE2]